MSNGRDESDELFEAFTGHDVDYDLTFKAPKIPSNGLLIGRIHSICYEATRDGETALYEHTFKEEYTRFLRDFQVEHEEKYLFDWLD